MHTTSGLSPIVDGVRGRALEWFTGKSRQDAACALDLLAASEAAEEWLPGASRKVAAALSKTNVARKLYGKYGKALEAIGGYDLPSEQRGWSVATLLQFGNWKRGLDIDFDAVQKGAKADELALVVDLARGFVSDFAPLVPLVERLDATRPAPVITSVGASPTVTKLLASLGLLLNAGTIRTPPIEWVSVERKTPAGKPYLAKVGYIHWPRGTVHNASRYAAGTQRNIQCHACGHAIKNAFNWVPLLLDSDDVVSVPHSLWVGRDCAETLFGIKVRGEVELEEIE